MTEDIKLIEDFAAADGKRKPFHYHVAYTFMEKSGWGVGYGRTTIDRTKPILCCSDLADIERLVLDHNPHWKSIVIMSWQEFAH